MELHLFKDLAHIFQMQLKWQALKMCVCLFSWVWLAEIKGVCEVNPFPSLTVRERTVRITKGTGDYPWGFRIQFSKPILVTEVDTSKLCLYRLISLMKIYESDLHNTVCETLNKTGSQHPWTDYGKLSKEFSQLGLNKSQMFCSHRCYHISYFEGNLPLKKRPHKASFCCMWLPESILFPKMGYETLQAWLPKWQLNPWEWHRRYTEHDKNIPLSHSRGTDLPNWLPFRQESWRGDAQENRSRNSDG